MLDVLYLVHNRREFTAASFAQLVRATNWRRVDRLVVYDDDSEDGAGDEIHAYAPCPLVVKSGKFGGPVAVMRHYLEHEPAYLFAKIDNDTMVPPGWLDECLDVMRDNPRVDLLGIEAFHPIGPGPREVVESTHIGGIGLMKSSVFNSPLEPNGRFGFTEWQHGHPDVIKAWMNPALSVALLDHVPVEPWASLSEEYVRRGWQRPWPKYANDDPRWTWLCS